MTKLFSLVGGRRFFAVCLTSATAFIAEGFFDPETAKRITDVVLYIAGTFILGESAADGLGRFKNGQQAK